MKLVSAAKLKRAQTAAINGRAYSKEAHKAGLRVSRRLGTRAPMLWRRPDILNCIDVFVISSDRGLCGGFNENLFRSIEDGIEDLAEHDMNAKLYVFGKKGIRYFSARKYDMEAIATGDPNEIAELIYKKMSERLMKGESCGGNIAFNRFVNGVKYKTVFWNLLPLHMRGDAFERNMEYLYEPARSDALDVVCKQVVTSSVVRALKESLAAEHAARMTAMDEATRNASDMIASLTLLANRIRQEEITSELLDIIGGAEAISS